MNLMLSKVALTFTGPVTAAGSKNAMAQINVPESGPKVESVTLSMGEAGSGSPTRQAFKVI